MFFNDGYSEVRKMCVDGCTERTRLKHIQDMISAWWPLVPPVEINVKLLELRECE